MSKNKLYTEKIVSLEGRIKESLFQNLDELVYFASDYYGETLEDITNRLSYHVEMVEGPEISLDTHLMLWAIFCYPISKRGKTVFQLFIENLFAKRKKNHPLVKQILHQWSYTTPGFYYVEKILDEEGRIYLLTDLNQGKEKVVCVYNEIQKTPDPGDFVTGIILPLEDGFYTTIIDFYNIRKSGQSAAQRIIAYTIANSPRPYIELIKANYPQMLSHALSEDKQPPKTKTLILQKKH